MGSPVSAVATSEPLCRLRRASHAGTDAAGAGLRDDVALAVVDSGDVSGDWNETG